MASFRDGVGRSSIMSRPAARHKRGSAPGTLAFRRGDGLVCMVNCGSRTARLPAEAGDLLVSSGDLSGPPGVLPPDTAAWFHLG